jgi:hypothetical protein
VNIQNEEVTLALLYYLNLLGKELPAFLALAAA